MAKKVKGYQGAQTVPYGNMGCRVSMGGIKELEGFWPKINIAEGNYCTDEMACCQKVLKK